MKEFTEDETIAIADALRVAANHYRDNAILCKQSPDAGVRLLAATFEAQARDAIKLMDKVRG